MKNHSKNPPTLGNHPRIRSKQIDVAIRLFLQLTPENKALALEEMKRLVASGENIARRQQDEIEAFERGEVQQ